MTTPQAAVRDSEGSPRTAAMTVVAVRSCDAELLGPEQLILAQAEHYRGTDTRFVIVNLSDGTPPAVALHEEAERRGIESVVVRDTSAFNAARMVPPLSRLFRQYRPDVIHTHGSKAETLTLFARGRGGAALVGSFYGRIAMGPLRWQLFDGASLVTLRAFGRVIANSQATARQLEAARFPMRKVRVVPSTVNMDVVSERSDVLRSISRGELGIAPSTPLVATMARLYDEKGHRFFLRAMPPLLDQHPELRWLIIGDGPLRSAIEDEARALGVADRLVFAGYRSEGWKLMAAADLCVVPSLREGISVSLLESAMLGMPIIATTAGGNPEVVQSQETGLLVRPGDSAELAQATHRLLNDPALAAKLGAQAAVRARAVFAPAAVCGATHHLYLEHPSVARRVAVGRGTST
jgi:glycosyltransferase involved in cell wall biosynthesis